jgi:hypothetical protein
MSINRELGAAKKFLPDLNKYEGKITFLNTPDAYLPNTLVFIKGTNFLFWKCWKLKLLAPDVPKLIQRHF